MNSSNQWNLDTERHFENPKNSSFKDIHSHKRTHRLRQRATLGDVRRTAFGSLHNHSATLSNALNKPAYYILFI